MGRILFDTTVLIDALRGRPAAQRIRELLGQRESLLTTAINVEEIFRGLRTDEKASAYALFTAVRPLPIRREEGELAGRWRAEYAARGITLHQADCLIGAAAVAVNARLGTANTKDFPMPELTVETWPIGK